MLTIVISLALGAGCSGGSCAVASAPAKVHVEKTRVVQRDRRPLFGRRGRGGCGGGCR